MKAVEERLIHQMLQNEPERYRRNGRQSKPRYLKWSLGTIPYRFAQLKDQPSGGSLMPLAEALAIPAYDHYLEEALEPGIGLSVHVSYRRARKPQWEKTSPVTAAASLRSFRAS